MAQIPAAGTDSDFYSATAKVEPRAVKGVFRTVKWWAMAVLMAWWHLAPFVRWDRGPGAPDQAILADIAGRRGYFFSIEIWPQEVYYVTGLLMIAAIGLFLMSALAGRVWCGFLCWQTVYTDLFVAVERLFIGDRNRRIALNRRPWDAGKLARKAAVNLVWLAISAACGISFVLYFDDAFKLLGEIFSGTAGAATYTAIFIAGGGCYLLAGFAREQVCIYMCPYSRFQAAMFDEHSLIISYEEWRGEPRGSARKGQSFDGRGHCVDCRMCVVACPTGIDIRNGSQLACIGCGLCIDACAPIMDRFGLPRGLIRYDSTANIEARGRGEAAGFRVVRPRTLVYAGVLALVGGVMAWSLAFRTTTEVNILHERSPLFSQMKDGSIRNGYTYKVLNMIRRDRTFALAVAGIDGARLEVFGGNDGRLDVAADSVGTFRVYVSVPAESLGSKSTALSFTLTDTADGRVVDTRGLFAAPER